MPDSLVYFGDSSFYGNALVTLTFPNTVTSIGSNAFGLNGMTTVTIGSGVETIGYHAFSFNSLSSVTINGEELRFNDLWTWYGFPGGLLPE